MIVGLFTFKDIFVTITFLFSDLTESSLVFGMYICAIII